MNNSILLETTAKEGYVESDKLIKIFEERKRLSTSPGNQACYDVVISIIKQHTINHEH